MVISSDSGSSVGEIMSIDSGSDISNNNSAVESITIVSSSSNSSVDVCIVGESSETLPSFDFESSAKLLLTQPRTSTPILQRDSIIATVKARKRKSISFFFEVFIHK